MPNDENTQQTLNQNPANNSNTSSNSGNSDDFDLDFGSDVGSPLGSENQTRTGMFLTPEEEAEKEDLINSGQPVVTQEENIPGDNATSSSDADLNIGSDMKDESVDNSEQESPKFDDKIEDLISFDDDNSDSSNVENNGGSEQNDDWLQQEDKKVEETFGSENGNENQNIEVNESPDSVAQNVENLFNNTTSEQVNNSYVPDEADFTAMSNLLNSSSTGQIDLNATDNKFDNGTIDTGNSNVSGVAQGDTVTSDQNLEQENVQTDVINQESNFNGTENQDTNTIEQVNVDLQDDIQTQENSFGQVDVDPQVDTQIQENPFGQVNVDLQNDAQTQENPFGQVNVDPQVDMQTQENPFVQVNVDPQVDTQIQENPFGQVNVNSQMDAQTQDNPFGQVNVDPQVDTKTQENPFGQVNVDSQMDTQTQENPSAQVNVQSQVDTQIQENPFGQVNVQPQVDLRNQGTSFDQVDMGPQASSQVLENSVNQINPDMQVDLRNQGASFDQTNLDASQVDLQNQGVSVGQNVDLNSIGTLGGDGSGNVNNINGTVDTQGGLSLDAILDQEIQNMHVENSNVNSVNNGGIIGNDQVQTQTGQQVFTQNTVAKKRKKQSGFTVIGIFLGVIILLGILGFAASKMFPDKFHNLFKGDVVVEYLSGNESGTDEQGTTDNIQEGNGVNNGEDQIIGSDTEMENLSGDSVDILEGGDNEEGGDVAEDGQEGEPIDPNSLAGLLSNENTGNNNVSGNTLGSDENDENGLNGDSVDSSNTGSNGENFDPFTEIDNILGGNESDLDKLNDYISQGNDYKELGAKNNDKKMERYGEYIVVTATEELSKLENGEEIDNTVFSKLDEILESLK